MIAQPDIKRYTAEEYLELEIASEMRHEYHDGDIRPMTSGTPDQNRVASNLLAILKALLRGKAYRRVHSRSAVMDSKYESLSLSRCDGHDEAARSSDWKNRYGNEIPASWLRCCRNQRKAMTGATSLLPIERFRRCRTIY